MISYVIILDGEWYGYIQFYQWALVLRKVNQRRAKCIECKERFEPGECVYHRQYHGSGYMCIPCARKMIVKYGPMGYSENVMKNLQANHLQTGKWQSLEVAAALQMDTISDGFGNMWDKSCERCGSRSMEIVRPGLARCMICEDECQKNEILIQPTTTQA